jgi:hypothetical protein
LLGERSRTRVLRHGGALLVEPLQTFAYRLYVIRARFCQPTRPERGQLCAEKNDIRIQPAGLYDHLLAASMQQNARPAQEALCDWQPKHDAGRIMRGFLRRFLDLSPADLIKSTAAIALVGTGAYVGHAFPDWDISWLGIGNHRNFAMHSALPVWAMYKVHKWAVNRVRPAVDSPLDFCCRAVGLFIGGACLGMALHLLVDATFQGNRHPAR